MRNESNSGRTFIGHYPPATILREKGLSVSIHVGTRKVSTALTILFCRYRDYYNSEIRCTLAN